MGLLDARLLGGYLVVQISLVPLKLGSSGKS